MNKIPLEERTDLKHATISRGEMNQMRMTAITPSLRARLETAGFRMNELPPTAENVLDIIVALKDPWTTFETTDGTIHFYQGDEGSPPL